MSSSLDGGRIWQACSRGFYRVAVWLMAAALRIFGQWTVEGAARTPATGPLIVISNHLNNADPPLLAASLPRPIRFMAKEELFRNPLGSLPVRLFGSFPVRRFKADLRALHMAQRLLDRGEVVGLFPEGHRSPNSSLIPAKPGPAILALRTGVPVLPVAITGTEQLGSLLALFKRPRITVRVGEPFAFTADGRVTSQQAKAASEEMMRRVAELLPRAYRGVYSESVTRERT